MRYLPPWLLLLSCLTYFVIAVGSSMVYSGATSRHTPISQVPPPPPTPTPTNSAPVKSGIPYEITAYAWTCIMPLHGPEPTHPTRAADGSWPRADETIAADWKLHPPGSEVLIEGLGYRVVTDRGRAIIGHKIDLFLASCDEARQWGRRVRQVWKVPRATTVYGVIE